MTEMGAGQLPSRLLATMLATDLVIQARAVAHATGPER